jgi:exosortase
MTQHSVEIQGIPAAAMSADPPWTVAGVRAGILAALLLYVFWAPVEMATARWSADANWSHGWLVPVFSLYFLWVRREQIVQTRPTTSYTGLVVLLLSLVGYFLFLVVRPYGYLQFLAMVGAILGITLFLTGWAMLRITWLPILFLCFANPIPDQYYVTLTMPLRLLTTRLAVPVLSLIPGAELEVEGVIISYYYQKVDGTLNVEEACAGMRLMMAFVTLGVAMAYIGDRPLWQRIGMVVACVPIAVFCNIVRVTATGVLTIYGYTDLAQGVAHQLLGLAMLPLALGLFALTGYVLKRLLVEEPPDAGTAIAERESA